MVTSQTIFTNDTTGGISNTGMQWVLSLIGTPKTTTQHILWLSVRCFCYEFVTMSSVSRWEWAFKQVTSDLIAVET